MGLDSDFQVYSLRFLDRKSSQRVSPLHSAAALSQRPKHWVLGLSAGINNRSRSNAMRRVAPRPSNNFQEQARPIAFQPVAV